MKPYVYKKPRVAKKRVILAAAISSVATPALAQLEEVVVTAQFKEQDLQSVPLAISVIDAKALEARNMTNALDINESVPNINMARNTGSGSAMKIFLRGIGEDDARVTIDTAVGIYIDDVYVGRQSAALFDLAGIDQIEVLRGPQGTLYGRNSNGGAVRITSRQPTLEDEVELKGSFGSDRLANGSIMVNHALSDNLAASVTLMNHSRRGYMKNTDNGDYLGDVDKSGARLAIKYFGETWETLFSADFTRDRSEPGYPSRVEDNDGDFFTTDNSQYNFMDTAYIGSGTELGDYFNTVYQSGYSLKASRMIGDMEFTSITAYREMQNELYTIISLPYYHDLEHWQASQEFRLQGEGDNSEWVTGLYFFHEDSDQYVEYIYGTADLQQTTDSVALFGQYTYDLTEKLHLTGGARYTFEKKDFESAVSDDYWVAAGIENQGSDDETWGQFSWKGIVAYDLNDVTMAYASIATGFKSGGWSPDTFVSVDEEKVTTYELGIKTSPTDSVRVNLNAFYNDYTDLQLNGTDPVIGGFSRFNAGDVKTYGLEASLNWQITDSLFLDAYAGTLEGEYSKVLPAAAYLIDEDRELKQAPEMTYGFSLTHTQPIASGELTSSLNYAFTDEQYNDIANTKLVMRDDTEIVNARIGYTWGGDTEYSVALWGKNLLDEEYAGAATSGNLSVYPGDPLTWGVDLEVSF